MSTATADNLRHAVRVRPDDAALRLQLAAVLRALGDGQGAYAELQRACELAPDSALSWLRLGQLLRDGAWGGRAQAALERAHALDQDNSEIALALGQVLAMRGHISDAAENFRRIIARDPHSMSAWFALSNLKTEPLDRSELAALESAWSQLGERADGDAGVFGGFALARALENVGRHDQAFTMYVQANARKRTDLAWDARRFSEQVDACIEMFTRDPRSARGDRGHEAVFIVGMPRSGSSLLEHCLARHPRVSAGGELPHVSEIIAEQSRRQNTELYVWAETLPRDEWERMGHEYLARTRRWYGTTSHFTDKGLANWTSVGVIQRMLPGARIVDCRRDPLETSWSCFSQLFEGERSPFAYDFHDIGAFHRDHDRMMDFCSGRFPGLIHRLDHEALLTGPEVEIRRVLDFLGLAFDPACLRFGEGDSEVFTESAAQVRQPLQSVRRRTDAFGALLDPLRMALAETPPRP